MNGITIEDTKLEIDSHTTFNPTTKSATTTADYRVIVQGGLNGRPIKAFTITKIGILQNL